MGAPDTTPGPWEVQDDLDCENEPGCAVLAVHADVAKGGTPTRGVVGYLSSVVGATFQDAPACLANAHQIAASPAMHDALLPLAAIPIGPEIADDLDLILYRNGNACITVGDVLNARASLALARGEA